MMDSDDDWLGNEYFLEVEYRHLDQLAEATQQPRFVIYYLAGQLWSQIHFGQIPPPQSGTWEEMQMLLRKKLEKENPDAKIIAKVCRSYGLPLQAEGKVKYAY